MSKVTTIRLHIYDARALYTQVENTLRCFIVGGQNLSGEALVAAALNSPDDEESLPFIEPLANLHRQLYHALTTNWMPSSYQRPMPAAEPKPVYRPSMTARAVPSDNDRPFGGGYISDEAALVEAAQTWARTLSNKNLGRLLVEREALAAKGDVAEEAVFAEVERRQACSPFAQPAANSLVH